MLKYELTTEQYNELAGLAYHHADLQYRREHCKLNDGERERDAKNVEQHFPALDAMGTPYWVQNTVLLWSEDWKRYERGGMREYLRLKNITVKA